MSARRRARLARTSLTFLVVVIVVVVVVVFHAGGAGSSKDRPAAALVVHYSVGIANCTFVDMSRSTPDYVNGTAKKGRVLVTEIRYPTLSPKGGFTETPNAHPAIAHGPFPVVIFGHGYRLTPDSYSALLDRWVKAGFVVAAPLFPDTNQNAVAQVSPANEFVPEADDVSQPGDLAFVTKSLIQAESPSSSLCDITHRLIKTNDFALAGQSDGATTVVALAYDPTYEVPGVHYKAVVDLSGELFGAGSQKPDKLVATSSSPPLLVSQSATDQCNPPQFSAQIYNGVNFSKKWFLKIDSAHHLPPYIGTDTAAFNVVAATTIKFFADEFAGVRPGAALLKVGSARPSVAHLYTGATAPGFAPLTQNGGTCYLTS